MFDLASRSSTTHGSRFVPLITGAVELLVGFLVAGLGGGFRNGTAGLLTNLVGGTFILLGLHSIFLAFFGSRELVDTLTVEGREISQQEAQRQYESIFPVSIIFPKSLRWGFTQKYLLIFFSLSLLDAILFPNRSDTTRFYLAFPAFLVMAGLIIYYWKRINKTVFGVFLIPLIGIPYIAWIVPLVTFFAIRSYEKMLYAKSLIKHLPGSYVQRYFSKWERNERNS